jgi:hypothetical protein
VKEEARKGEEGREDAMVGMAAVAQQVEVEMDQEEGEARTALEGKEGGKAVLAAVTDAKESLGHNRMKSRSPVTIRQMSFRGTSRCSLVPTRYCRASTAELCRSRSQRCECQTP